MKRTKERSKQIVTHDHFEEKKRRSDEKQNLESGQYHDNNAINHRHTGPMTMAVFDLLGEDCLRYIGFIDGILRYRIFVAKGAVVTVLNTYLDDFTLALLKNEDVSSFAPPVWKGGKLATLFKMINGLNRTRDDVDNIINDINIINHVNFPVYREYLESGKSAFSRIFDKINTIVKIGYEDPRVYKKIDTSKNPAPPVEEMYKKYEAAVLSTEEINMDLQMQRTDKLSRAFCGNFDHILTVLNDPLYKDTMEKKKNTIPYKRIIILDHIAEFYHVANLSKPQPFGADFDLSNAFISQNEYMVMWCPKMDLKIRYLPDMHFSTNDSAFRRFKVRKFESVVYNVANKIVQAPTQEPDEIKLGLNIFESSIYLPRPISTQAFLTLSKEDNLARLYVYESFDPLRVGRADNMQCFVFAIDNFKMDYSLTLRCYLYYNSIVITDLLSIDGEKVDQDVCTLAAKNKDLNHLRVRYSGIRFHTKERNDMLPVSYDIHIIEPTGKRKRASAISKIYVDNFATWIADYICKFGYDNFFNLYSLHPSFEYIKTFLDGYKRNDEEGKSVISAYDPLDLLLNNTGNHPVVVSADTRFLPPLIINIKRLPKNDAFPRVDSVFTGAGVVSKYYFVMKHRPALVKSDANFVSSMSDKYLTYHSNRNIDLPVSPYARFPNNITDELYDKGLCDYAYYLRNVAECYTYSYIVDPNYLDDMNIYIGGEEKKIRSDEVRFYNPKSPSPPPDDNDDRMG